MIAFVALSFGLVGGLRGAGPLSAQAGETPVRLRLCPGDAPEGVHLPPRPGCGAREGRGPRRDAGFHEIVPGTSIRVGARASATFDARR